jgi:hypothetical protein
MGVNERPMISVLLKRAKLAFAVAGICMSFATSALAQSNSVVTPQTRELSQTVVNSRIYHNNKVVMYDTRRPATVATTAVASGKPIASVPIRYRRTAVLTQDLRTKTDVGLAWASIQEIVAIKSGGRGYWAGRRANIVQEIGPIWQRADQSERSGDFSDVWCFFGEDRNAKPDQICITVTPDRQFAPTFVGTTELMFGRVIRAAYLSTFTYDRTDPITNLAFEETATDVIPDLLLEYSVLRWGPERVVVGLNAQGYRVTELTVRPNSKGEAILATPFGLLVITESASTPQTYQAKWDDRTAITASAFNPAEMAPPELSFIEGSLREEATKFTKSADILAKLSSPMVRYQVAPNEAPVFVETIANRVVTTRRVELASFVRQTASPQNRPNRYGDAGAILFAPINMAMRRLYCLDSNRPFEAGTVPARQRYHCIEDVDGDGVYEVLWRDPIFTPADQSSLVSLFGQYALGSATAPVIKVEPVEVSNPPTAQLELLNSGISGTRVDAAGELKPTAIGFSLRVAGMQPKSFDYFVELSSVVQTYDVELDENGNGVFKDAEGNVLIEVSNAKIDGKALVKLGSSFLAGREQLIRYDALVASPRERAARLMQAADKVKALVNEDISPLLR